MMRERAPAHTVVEHQISRRRHRVDAHPITALQRLAGNAAVTAVLQRDAIPGYAQRGDTCQPASLITAFRIWDRERATPGTPNGNMISACDGVLVDMHRRRAALVTRLSAGGKNGDVEYKSIEATVQRIAAALRAPGSVPTQTQFQDLAEAISRLYDSTDAVLRVMGIALKSQGHDSLNAIFGSPLLTGLNPGQVAQIEWYVNTRAQQGGREMPVTGYHAFLIGRKADGSWFLSDQGNTPPLVLRDFPDLSSLRTALDTAAASGRSWIDTRPTTTRLQLTWTGVRLLDTPENVDARHRRLLPPGQPLGEVDPGTFSFNIAMTTWDWVGSATSLAAAKGLYPTSGIGHGFVITELPAGTFNVAKTNPVNSDALSGTFIPGGLLARSPPAFLHAWIHLATPAGTMSTRMTPVY